jgi:hypothetical protein
MLKNLLQKYPGIAVFLTLAIDLLIGKIQFEKFSLGPKVSASNSVTGCAWIHRSCSAFQPLLKRLPSPPVTL